MDPDSPYNPPLYGYEPYHQVSQVEGYYNNPLSSKQANTPNVYDVNMIREQEHIISDLKKENENLNSLVRMYKQENYYLRKKVAQIELLVDPVDLPYDFSNQNQTEYPISFIQHEPVTLEYSLDTVPNHSVYHYHHHQHHHNYLNTTPMDLLVPRDPGTNPGTVHVRMNPDKNHVVQKTMNYENHVRKPTEFRPKQETSHTVSRKGTGEKGNKLQSPTMCVWHLHTPTSQKRQYTEMSLEIQENPEAPFLKKKKITAIDLRKKFPERIQSAFTMNAVLSCAINEIGASIKYVNSEVESIQVTSYNTLRDSVNFIINKILCKKVPGKSSWDKTIKQTWLDGWSSLDSFCATPKDKNRKKKLTEFAKQHQQLTEEEKDIIRKNSNF